MRLRRGSEGVLIHDGRRWVALARATDDPRVQQVATDVLTFLRADDEVREAAGAAIAAAGESATADGDAAALPFAPRSLRAFMLWEPHVIASSRMLVKHFFPAPAWKAVNGFERLTGKT